MVPFLYAERSNFILLCSFEVQALFDPHNLKNLTCSMESLAKYHTKNQHSGTHCTLLQQYTE